MCVVGETNNKQVAERLTELEEQGRIQGVLDERSVFSCCCWLVVSCVVISRKCRGNYIYVTDEELAAIGKWVQRKGQQRVCWRIIC